VLASFWSTTARSAVVNEAQWVFPSRSNAANSNRCTAVATCCRAPPELPPPPHPARAIAADTTGTATAPSALRSRSYLIDVWETATDAPVVGYATYEHDYKKVADQWKIAQTAIEWI
jgi:hypothetical protein